MSKNRASADGNSANRDSPHSVFGQAHLRQALGFRSSDLHDSNHSNSTSDRDSLVTQTRRLIPPAAVCRTRVSESDKRAMASPEESHRSGTYSSADGTHLTDSYIDNQSGHDQVADITYRQPPRETRDVVLEDSDALPNNVSTLEQLPLLPDNCVSTSRPNRPLRHVHETGEVSHYALRPMTYSVLFILVVELLERFSFYGIEYTQTSYLTGAYDRTYDHGNTDDEEWNAGMTSVRAASYVSISTAVAYTAPFLGAYIADAVLGDYWSILLGCAGLYLPGLVLITMTTVPYLLGEEFNHKLLSLGLLVLWPFGTGMVKSIVNVFGAKQFHPILQSSLIESYYVNFYMCINIGALIGGFAVPVLAQHDITLAYSLCVAMLAIGVLVFVLGTPRYVRQRKLVGNLFDPAPSIDYNNGLEDGDPVSDVSMMSIFKVTILIMPFSITYSQMATTFIVQGTVMRKALFIDAASMNNMDALSVLFFGYLIGAKLYPALARRKMKIPTTYKFATGSAFGALAICWAIFVEYKIHSTYGKSGERISVLWQSGSYILIGAGEIFAISTAYEAAFSIAPPQKKVLASAVNLFSYGGIPNVLCIGLYNVCASWFESSHGSTSIIRIEDYTSAHVVRYFWLLLAISLAGVAVNVLPVVRRFVDGTEQTASETFRTPVMNNKMKRLGRKQRGVRDDTDADADADDDYSDDDSTSSLLMRTKRHQAYLKYGSVPVLYKSGSIHSNAFGGEPGFDDADGRGEDRRRKKRTMIRREDLSRLYGNVETPKAPKRPRKKTLGEHGRAQSM